jgi:hypothetical protein
MASSSQDCAGTWADLPHAAAAAAEDGQRGLGGSDAFSLITVKSTEPTS